MLTGIINNCKKLYLYIKEYLRNDLVQYRILICLFVILPFIILFGWLHFIGAKLTWLTPWHTDAQEWYSQVKSVLKYGHPLGHFGYFENPPKVGNFGPWGAAIIYFVSFGGRIFGWHPWSPMLADAFKWTVANLCFFLFVRPNKRQLVRLCLLHFVLFVNIIFMFRAMADVTRASMAIFMAGMIYYLLYSYNKDSAWYKILMYIIAPILLCLFTMAYTLFGLCMIFYGYALYKHITSNIKFVWIKAVLTIVLIVIIPIVLTLTMFYFAGQTSAPYFGGTPLNNFVRDNNVKKLILDSLNYGFRNLQFLRYSNLLNGNFGGLESGMVLSYKIIINTLALFSIADVVLAIIRKNQRKNIELAFMIMLTLVSFLLAHCFFYTLGGDNYMRGMNVSLNFAAYLFCVFEPYRVPKYKYIDNVLYNHYRFIAIYGIMLMCLMPFFNWIYQETAQFKTDAFAKRFAEREKVYAQYMKLDPKGDVWDNTVADYHFTRETHVCTYSRIQMQGALPVGMAHNRIHASMPVNKCKYIMGIAQDLNKMSPQNYKLVYSDKEIFIFERK